MIPASGSNFNHAAGEKPENEKVNPDEIIKEYYDKPEIDRNKTISGIIQAWRQYETGSAIVDESSYISFEAREHIQQIMLCRWGKSISWFQISPD